jgi:hypothetical protein
MKRFLPYLLSWLLLAASCTDAVEIDTGLHPASCLAVDGMVTDRMRQQVVRLSLTTDFFSPSTEIPWVSGATVSVSCGEQVFDFKEDPNEPGTYRSVSAFKGEAGRTYRLDVDAMVGGVPAHYSAEDTVPEPGVRLDALDYLYSKLLDNLWTLALWGRDIPGPRTRYMVQVGVNGHFKPQDKSFELPDDHFNGMAFKGFTISALHHTPEAWETYGDSFKPLEKGDVITLRILTLSEAYGGFLMKYSHLNFGTIPILTEQPANLPTNITGTAPAVGYFGACAVSEVNCIVDDPYRTEYRLRD